MKKQKMLAFALTGLMAISAIGLSSGRVVKADTTTASTAGVTYRGHVQSIGWQPWVSDGAEAGTDGKSLRVEALDMTLTNVPSGAHIEYQAHVQNIGWQSPVEDGAEAGTDGKSLRVEAIKIAVVGLPGYSVQYRAHVQSIGWQAWVSDGVEAGTDGKGLRIEAIEARVVKTADGSTPTPASFSTPTPVAPTEAPGHNGNEIKQKLYGLGFYDRDGGLVINEYGPTGMDTFDYLDFDVMSGNYDMSLTIYISNPEMDAKVKTIINWILPTQGNTLWSILQNPKLSSQTLQLDKRTVTIDVEPRFVTLLFGPTK